MSASDKKKLRKEQDAATLTEKQLNQKKEDKQLKNYTLTFAVVMILVVAIALGSMGFNWFNNSGIPARYTTALTIGDQELSNADLNYYFIDSVSRFYTNAYNSYGSYTTLYVQMYYGLDMTQPLNTQYYNETTGETWADYFVQDAISYAEETYTLYNAAMADGFVLTADQETAMNAALAKEVADAGLAGYSTFDAYLKANYGNGADEKSYVEYYRVNATANAYYAQYANTLTYTKDEIDAYNAENYDKFSAFDYSYYYVGVNSFLPEDVKAADATEDQREAARAEAEAEANKLAQSKTLDILNKNIANMAINAENDKAAATEINMAGISNISTLYSEWIADSSRVAGETTVVEFESESDSDELVDGYYVVLFEGRKDFNEKMRAVRHILFKFEGGTKDDAGNTTYSDAEKQKARDDAQQLYDQWVAGGASEESFIELVKDNSDDGGSVNNGGLYENVFDGAMVENFNDWLFDSSRQAGDHAVVETEIGYHLMYFVGEQDNTYREYNIEAALRNKDVSEWYTELMKNVTSVEGNTSYIYKGLVLASSSNTSLY